MRYLFNCCDIYLFHLYHILYGKFIKQIIKEEHGIGIWYVPQPQVAKF